MNEYKPDIESSWYEILKSDFQASYFSELKEFLIKEKKQYSVYPPGDKIFAAFNKTPFPKVKVVILGQDPYHGPGQANGLSFSVSRDMPLPPSLKNIYLELKNDLGIEPSPHGDLSAWARQGVLLLNAFLTVRHRSPGSHQNCGWERFTDRAIAGLSQQQKNLVFFLWGKFAQSKLSLINSDKHLVISTSHPSPFSAHRGFFGSKPFSQANRYLRAHGKEPIDWQL